MKIHLESVRKMVIRGDGVGARIELLMWSRCNARLSFCDAGGAGPGRVRKLVIL